MFEKPWSSKLCAVNFRSKENALALLLLLSACSTEKVLPLPCDENPRETVKELCKEYRQSGLAPDERDDLLQRYGFNKRDSQFIISETGKQKVRCRVAVAKQCDLISLRNGVGY